MSYNPLKVLSTDDDDFSSTIHEFASSSRTRCTASGNAAVYEGNIAAACAAANNSTPQQPDLTATEQKKRRLDMNRTNAQRNRDRKRIMIDMLQTEKSHMTASNKNLRQENGNLRQQIDQMKHHMTKHNILTKHRFQQQGAPPTTQILQPKSAPVVNQEYATPAGQAPSTPASLYQQDYLVNAMARDILIQEQLLVHRLNQTSSRFPNNDIAALFVKVQENGIHQQQKVPGQEEFLLPGRTKEVPGIQSRSLAGGGPRDPSVLTPNAALELSLNRYNRGRRFGLSVGQTSPTGALLSSRIDLPARGALLSSITPIEAIALVPDFSLFTPVSSAMPKADSLDKTKQRASPEQDICGQTEQL